MEICVTVFIDIDDSVKDADNSDLNTISPERQQAVLEQTTQSVVKNALTEHFKNSEGIEVGFVNAETVPQS